MGERQYLSRYCIAAPVGKTSENRPQYLFGFYEDITQQELILLCKEIHEKVISDGFDTGFSIAQEKICEYPNSDTLLHNLALQLQGLLATADLDEVQSTAYMKKIDTWYERLTQSSEAVIRNSACFMLASRAITEKQYERAQEYLDQMPSRADTPDKRMLQATIYMGQNQSEEAAKLLERTLLTSINDVQMVMYKLIDANIALGDNETAAYVAERVTRLAESFDLNQYNTVVAPFQVAVANKDVTQTIALLKKMLDAMSETWCIQASPLYRRVATNDTGTSMKKMVGLLLQGLRQAPEYAYLQDNDDFQALLTEYEGKT